MIYTYFSLHFTNHITLSSLLIAAHTLHSHICHFNNGRSHALILVPKNDLQNVSLTIEQQDCNFIRLYPWPPFLPAPWQRGTNVPSASTEQQTPSMRKEVLESSVSMPRLLSS
jgi:hypothetical protein